MEVILLAMRLPLLGLMAIVLFTDSSMHINASTLSGVAVDPVGSLVPTTIGQNLIINGGFESPIVRAAYDTYRAGATFGSWTVFTNSVDHLGPPGHTGMQAIDLNGYDAGELYQDVTTVINQRYLLSYWIYSSPRTPTEDMAVWWGGNRVATVRTTDGVWVRHSHSVVALTPTTRLLFQSLRPGNDGAYLDDISLYVESNIRLIQGLTNQIVRLGTNVTFRVTVETSSASSSLTYVWRLNGTHLVTTTTPVISISNVREGNAGLYSVQVSDSTGASVISSASLAVLAEPGANDEHMPRDYCPAPIKSPDQDSLIIITHGWQPLGRLSAVKWVDDMVDAIEETVLPNWYVMACKWQGGAGPTPGRALSFAANLGGKLGKELGTQGWSHIHLIGHSAGAALIETASVEIKRIAPSTVVHTTFLDAYRESNGSSQYGESSDWSDNYFSHDLLTSWFTEPSLNHAFNVDVTVLDPDRNEFLPGASTHEWPHDFYHATITNSMFANGFGFPFSKEGGNWDFARIEYPKDEYFSFGLSQIEQGTIPSSSMSVGFEEIPAVVSETGIQLHGKGFSAFTGVSASAGPAYLSSSQSSQPVWVTVGITITNPVNFVSFEAEFTSQSTAAGVLTVYWNTNQLGFLDEGAVVPGLQEYSFSLPELVTNGVYSLGFRLDSFSTVSSSIVVTNVALGFTGLAVPVSFSNSQQNAGDSVFSLTGPVGYYYVIQASTNFVDWEGVASVFNETGTVEFIDTGATNFTQRFYRALSP